MGTYFRHTAALAAILCLAVFAAGCGDDNSAAGTVGTAYEATGGASGATNNTVEKAAGQVPADVKAKQDALAKEAEEIKAKMKKEARAGSPEGTAGQKCHNAHGYTHITTVGFKCAVAMKFLVAGDNRWATLPSISTKVKGYACARVTQDKTSLHFRCSNLGRTIQFRLPTG